MVDFSRDDWRLVPNDAIETENNQDAAQAWGDAQRKQIAARWADAINRGIRTPGFADPNAIQPSGYNQSRAGGFVGAGAVLSSPYAQPSSQPASPPGSAAPDTAPPALTPSDQPDSGASLVGVPQSDSSPAPSDQSGRGAPPVTTAALSGGVPKTVSQEGGAFYGLGDREMGIARQAGDEARRRGFGDEGAKALQAILLTEGGLTGARGDQGQSAGPLQFYKGGGQLNNFAKQNGMSESAAMDYVEQNPVEAIKWALGDQDKPGYLGAALKYGISKGLTGADLATYAQKYGQVSVSPERAGQWHNTVFGGGQDPFASPITGGAAGATARGYVAPPVTGAGVANAKEDRGQQPYQNQFQLGLSDGDAYAACYDGQTRVLTRRGFVFFSDLTGDDELATRRDDGVIEYHRPFAIQHYWHHGPMVEIRNLSVDLLVTPDHQILAYKSGGRYTRNGKVEVQPSLVRAAVIADTSSGWSIPVHSSWPGDHTGADSPVRCRPEQWGAFVGLWIAEGHMDGRQVHTDGHAYQSNRVSVTQAIGATTTAVKRVMGGLGVSYTTQPHAGGPVSKLAAERYRFANRAICDWLRPLGKQPMRYIPRDLMQADPGVLNALLMGLWLGDGDKTTHTGYTTTSKQLAEDVAELAIKLGCGANIQVRQPKENPLWLTRYFVSVRAAANYYVHPKRNISIIPNWEGDVYCATVPNHTLLVERNGKITWCGNCGPAAAIAFAKANGRNPTTDEAMQLAKSVGWSQNQGMAGVASEQGLLNKMNVSTTLERDVDWNHVAKDATNGNPVIVSTPGHYFYVDDVRQGYGGNNQFHVGGSGTALKGGSEWMTADEIQQRMGKTNGALYADHPLAEGPSTTETSPTAVDKWQEIPPSGRIFPTPTDQIQGQPGSQSGFNADTSGINTPLGGQPPVPSAPPGVGDMQMPFAMTPPKSVHEALDQASKIVQNTPRPLAGPGGLGAYDPRLSPLNKGDTGGAGEIADLSLGGKVADVGETLGPERTALRDEAVQIINKLDSGAEDSAPLLDRLQEIDKLMGPTELSAGLTPGQVKGAAQPFIKTAATAFEPAANIPEAQKSAFERFAATVGPSSRAAKVEGEQLQRRVDKVMGDMTPQETIDAIKSFEKTGEFSADPTPEQSQLAADLRQDFQQSLQHGEAHGYGGPDVTKQPGGPNFYFPHSYADESPPGIPTGETRSLAPGGELTQERQFKTIDEAVAAGKVPDSLGEAIKGYVINSRDNVAKTQLIDDLSSVPGSMVKLNKFGEVLEGMVKGSSIDQRITSPLKDYAVDPELARSIRNVLTPSAIDANPLGRAVLTAMSTAKQGVFSLSNFHAMTEGLVSYYSGKGVAGREVGNNFMRAMFSPDFMEFQRSGPMADTFLRAAKAGLVGLTEKSSPDALQALLGNVPQGITGGIGGAGAGYTQTKLTGGTDEEAQANALKYGAAGAALGGLPMSFSGKNLPRILSEATFERAVPMAKVTFWDGLVKSGMDEVAAAKVANQRFGGLNYDMMGRSKTLQDALRIAAMAPDWNESTLRTIANTVMGPGKSAGVDRQFLAKAIFGTAMFTEATQYALSGHLTVDSPLGPGNERGHEGEVEVQLGNGRMVHTGIGPGNLIAYGNLINKISANPAQAGDAAVGFAKGRLSPVGSTVVDVMSRDRRTLQEGAPGIAQRIAPIGVEQVAQGSQSGVSPAVTVALAALGLNPRYSAPQSQRVVIPAAPKAPGAPKIPRA